CVMEKPISFEDNFCLVTLPFAFNNLNDKLSILLTKLRPCRTQNLFSPIKGTTSATVPNSNNSYAFGGNCIPFFSYNSESILKVTPTPANVLCGYAQSV